MSTDWLDGYLEAWQMHPFAGSPAGADAMARLLDFMSDDVLYEDVPTAHVYRGHQGIIEMSAGAHQMSDDLTFDVVSHQMDGDRYAFETVARGTNTGAIGNIPCTGLPIELRGASVGRISDDALVVEHRDYWDLAGLLRRLQPPYDPAPA
jgi:steroid delta-isomerase-like uncharacterized protein